MNSDQGELEFSKHFPPSETEREIKNAKEWEAFLSEHREDMAIELLASDQKKQLEYRKAYFIAGINYLESLRKKRFLSDNTPFSVLLAYVKTEKQKVAQKTPEQTNSEDYDLFALLKCLVELEEEGLDGNTKINDVIMELNSKYLSIKDL